jgi:hypothetical protein
MSGNSETATLVDLEALADRVASLVVERLADATGRRWLSPAELAEVLGVERSWVYENAARLGARRLGDGPKARLRFRLDDVERATACSESRGSRLAATRTVEPKRQRRGRGRLGTDIELVPVRGRRGGS